MALCRVGSRLAGVAARSLLTGSHAAKGGADIPIAGLRAHLPNTSGLLRPKGVGHYSQERFSHTKPAPTLVMVVVHEDPDLARVYAESLSKAARDQILVLHKVHLAPPASEVNPESTDVNPDADSKLDLPKECPGDPHVVSFVVDGLSGLTEAEIEMLFDNKMRTVVRDGKDPCVAAIEQMGRNLDSALQGVKWNQQICFEKLDARAISQSLLLEDLHKASKQVNFVEAALSEAGRRMFHKKVIWAKRSLLTLVPYASRYYFYCLSAYSLLMCDVPLRPVDYALIVVGAQWMASDEMRGKFLESYNYFKNGGKKVDAGDAGKKI
ncbi:hypothetical protein VPH35_017573 [Triticum aestivum]